MKKDVEFIDEKTALMHHHDIIVMMETPSVTPAAPKPKESGNSPISPWGSDNDFPQKIIELASKSTELASLLDWKDRALQGREVIAVNQVWNPTKSQYEESAIDDNEINEFLSSRMFKRYWREASTDFNWFWNIFPELIKNVKGDKIASVGIIDASYCRWGKMNDRGIIETCYVSADWPSAKADDQTTLKINVVDPYSPTVIEDIQKAKNIKSFVYPVSYPSPGKSYYQLAPWDGWRVSGWPELAQMIPRSKVKLMTHLLSAKFILEIPGNYWPQAYPNWSRKSFEEQKEIKRAKVKEVNDLLTGVENTGKTILFDAISDANGNPLPSWKIIPIEDKLRDGNFLEDSREASQHLRSALNLDSALTGDGPGKSLGGGGGDKRIALNIFVALLQPYREVLLEPVYFIAEYNGWLKRYPRLKFKTVEIQLETLDVAHQTSKIVAN